jgi:hypothetical protein
VGKPRREEHLDDLLDDMHMRVGFPLAPAW